MFECMADGLAILENPHLGEQVSEVADYLG